jgi:hypothetical protein
MYEDFLVLTVNLTHVSAAVVTQQETHSAEFVGAL